MDYKREKLSINSWLGDKLKQENNPPNDNNKNEEELAEYAWGSRAHEFFSSDWSVAGLKYVVLNGASALRRIIWLLFVLFGFGFMTYQIYERMAFYLKSPTTVDIKVNYKTEIDFPTVTVCNENIIDATLAKDFANFDELMKVIYPPYPNPKFIPVFTDETKAKFADVTQWEDAWKQMSPSSEKRSINQCTYNQNDCDMKHIEYVSTSMGYCLQFNGATYNYTSTRAGATYGLWLLLYADQTNYLYTKSRAAGFKVLLHTKNDVPFVYELGFKAPVGQVTGLGIQLKTISQLPSPYGNCSDKSGYLYKSCVNSCLHDYVNSICKCRYFYYNASTDNNACNPQEMYECADPAATKFVADRLSEELCNCPPQCLTDYYQYQLSSSTASNYAMDTVAHVLCDERGLICDEANKSQIVTEVRRDFCEVEIYFDELLHEEIKTIPAYTILALLCDVGGALGLILGSTVLTLFELFDFVIVLIYDYFAISKRGKKSTKVGST